jgi:hypothetical protein
VCSSDLFIGPLRIFYSYLIALYRLALHIHLMPSLVSHPTNFY